MHPVAALDGDEAILHQTECCAEDWVVDTPEVLGLGVSELPFGTRQPANALISGHCCFCLGRHASRILTYIPQN
jgi:hypothetical protein